MTIDERYQDSEVIYENDTVCILQHTLSDSSSVYDVQATGGTHGYMVVWHCTDEDSAVELADALVEAFRNKPQFEIERI